MCMRSKDLYVSCIFLCVDFFFVWGTIVYLLSFVFMCSFGDDVR